MTCHHASRAAPHAEDAGADPAERCAGAPGLHLGRLETSEGFFKDAPILVITDGVCDSFTVRREHAFLMPEGARLPFRTAAPIFRFEPPSQ